MKEPSVKQYKALMLLGAIPLSEPKDGRREPVLTQEGLPTYDTTTTEVGYGGGAGGGKSYLGCHWLHMMCKRYPGTRWFIAREELKKLKESSLLTLFGVFSEFGMREGMHYKYQSISGRIKFNNGPDGDFNGGSEIFLVGLENQPSDPMFTRFGSTEFSGGFIDEANECPFRGYEILKSRIRYKLENFCPHCAGSMSMEDKVGEIQELNPDPTGSDDKYIERNVYVCPSCKRENFGLTPKILSTFNPDKGWVFNTFYKPWRDKTELNHVKFIPALVTDNKFIPKAYIGNLRRMKNKVDKERLLYGNFDYDNTPGRLYEYDELQDMFKRDLEKDTLRKKSFVNPDYKQLLVDWGKCHKTGYEYRITCDPARHGRDLAVILVWNKLSIEEIYVYHYSDLTELEQRITILWDKYNIGPRETIVDDDGVGGGLVDALKCRGFINRSAPIQPKAAKKDPLRRVNYQTIKDQCYFELANYIEDMAITKESIFVFGKSTSVKNAMSSKGDDKLTPEQIKERILEELDSMVEIDIDIDGPKKVIKKKDIKEKIGRSPDFGDAIMMRMYWEIKRSTRAFVYSSQ